MELREYVVRDLTYFDSIRGDFEAFITGKEMSETDKEFIIRQFLGEEVGKPLVYDYVLKKTKEALVWSGTSKEDQNVPRYNMRINDKLMLDSAFVAMALRLINISRKDRYFPVMLNDTIFTFSNYSLDNFNITKYV